MSKKNEIDQLEAELNKITEEGRIRQEENISLNLSKEEMDVDHELSVFINSAKTEAFVDSIIYRQNLDSLKLNTEKIADNLGNNHDFASNREGKNYITDLPEEFSDIKKGFSDLIENGNLRGYELKSAKKIVRMIDNMDSNLNETDFTKNALIINDFDKLTDRILDEVHEIDDKEDLLTRANQRPEDELEEKFERQKRMEQRKEKMEAEGDTGYVDPTINIDTNPLLKLSQQMLENANNLQNEALKRKLSRTRMNKATADNILNCINLNPAIYGKNVNLETMFKVQKNKQRRDYENLSFARKMLFDLNLETRVSYNYTKRALSNNPLTTPIGYIFNFNEKQSVERDKPIKSFKSLYYRFQANNLHAAGMLLGKISCYKQIAKVQAQEKRDEMADKPKMREEIKDRLAQSFSDLNNKTILNIRSIMDDAKHGIVSPIVQNTLETISNKKDDLSKNISDRVQSLIKSKQSQEREEPKLNPNKMTLGF